MATPFRFEFGASPAQASGWTRKKSTANFRGIRQLSEPASPRLLRSTGFSSRKPMKRTVAIDSSNEVSVAPAWIAPCAANVGFNAYVADGLASRRKKKLPGGAVKHLSRQTLFANLRSWQNPPACYSLSPFVAYIRPALLCTTLTTVWSSVQSNQCNHYDGPKMAKLS
jgi:hypothetical protein